MEEKDEQIKRLEALDKSLIELSSTIKESMKKKDVAWHKHPIFTSLATFILTMILMGMIGWFNLPAQNKTATQNNTKAIEELTTALTKLSELPEKNKEELHTHIQDDTRRWDATNVNFENADENFQRISKSLNIPVTRIKQLDVK